MKILFLPVYHYPEKAASLYLGENAREEYARLGWKMKMFCPYPTRGVSDEVRREYILNPNTEELGGALSVERFKLSRESRNPIVRAIRYFICQQKHYRLAKKEKDTDVLFISSTPPIQGLLMDDDCFLPGFRREPSALTKSATLSADYGDASALLNGIDRRIWGNDNGYFGKTNKAITYTFDTETLVNGVRLVFDSDLDREYTYGNPDALHTSSTLFFPKSYKNTSFGFPKCLVKHYKIEVMGEGGEWQTAVEVFDNHQRFIKHELSVKTKAVRLVPLSTYHSETKTEDYGSSTAHVFNFELY